jgi:hypothetical protein
MMEIQTTPSHVNPAYESAPEPNLIVTMPGVAETIKTDIEGITPEANIKLVNL